MSHSAPIDVDGTSPPFDQFGSIHRLAAARSGHAPGEHARHQLYVARDKRSRANVLVKITSKPGLVYEQELTNEIASLSTINRELPDSRYFPVLGEHGRLHDSRIYLVMSLFDEWPVATIIGPERAPVRQAAHLRTTIEVSRALIELHGLKIWHVDLNPMNILCRWENGKPVIRIVDFESSYEAARHSRGIFYNPPTTSAYSAPRCPLTRRMRDRICSLWAPCSTRCSRVLNGRGPLTSAGVSVRILKSLPGSKRSCSLLSTPIPTDATRPSSNFVLPWPRTSSAPGPADRGRRGTATAAPAAQLVRAGAGALSLTS